MKSFGIGFQVISSLRGIAEAGARGELEAGPSASFLPVARAEGKRRRAWFPSVELGSRQSVKLGIPVDGIGSLRASLGSRT